MDLLAKLARHLADRVIIMVLIAGVTLVAIGGWLYAHDRSALETEVRLKTERAGVEANLAKTQARLEQLSKDIAAEQDRVTRSAKIVTDLEQLDRTWSWFGGNRAQAKANAERLAHMKEFHSTASARVLALRQEMARTTWERDGHEIALKQIDSRLQAEEAKKSVATYYLGRAWLRARSWLIFAAALYVLGPVLWRRVMRKKAVPRSMAG